MNKMHVIRLKGIAMHLWLAKHEAAALAKELDKAEGTVRILGRVEWASSMAYQLLRDRLSLWGDGSMPDEKPKQYTDYQAPSYQPKDLGEGSMPPAGFFNRWAHYVTGKRND